MEDPNLPQDMQQQQQPPRQRGAKQLPSLQGGAGGEEPAAAAAAADARPRKKKPRQRAPSAGGGGQQQQQQQQQPAESSPDHGTAPISPQQQLLPPATDDAAAPARRPRRKKRPRAAAAGGEEGPTGEDARRSPEGREAEGAATAPPAADTRTRHIDVEGMPLAKALETVREDVVTRGDGGGGGGGGGRVNAGADLTDGGDDDRQQPRVAADEDEPGGQIGGRRAGESNMSDTIFWQTQDARTFKAEKIDKYQQRLEQERKEREQYLEGVVVEDTSNRTLKCAIGFTKVYNYLGTVLLGLMPGFAILHTGYVWTLSSGYLAFLADYSSLASPMPILYYVVLTLILLSVLDRYDTGKLDRQSCLDCASFRHAGMVVLLYVPAYVVSNAMYPTDQWIRRYSYNTTAYAGLATGDSLVQSWRVMDAVRAACLVLGWLVVSFNTQFNKLAANLETELDDLIGEDQRMEMGPSVAPHAGAATGKSVMA